MIRFLFFVALVLVGTFSSAQDFSNKGKDFWLCFPSHVPNERFGTVYYAKMSLFITSDKSSSGTVSISGAFTTSFTVAAGQVTEINVPYNNAHISAAEAGTVIKKGIRVKVDEGKPAVVVYSQIYAGFRSAASLILPTAVLGKKYYSMNAPQQSISGSKSQFVIVAADTNTTVQITPIRDGVKGTAFAITLPLPGDLYEFQDDKDLTGSIIESISNGEEGCKRIAVFSGSSAININSANPCIEGDSYDPLYQQLYPVTAWGKTYGFMPFENYSNGSPYRIVASENNTKVSINGFVVATLSEGQCYPDNGLFGITETKGVLISGDKPISVAQYAQRSGCSGAVPPAGQGYGDPDMVILNPVEQSVNNITVFSSQRENIYADSKFINVLIKSTSTASFTINGVKPFVVWSPLLPAGSGYSFAKIKLASAQSSFTLRADSGFNAMAYGFGDFESYAYSAGTNVKDLYRVVRIENEFGDADAPVGCRDQSFRISVTFPYEPSSIRFLFNGMLNDVVLSDPSPVETLLVNGKTVYRYRVGQLFKIDSTGVFPFKIEATQSQVNACTNGEDIIEFDIQMIDRPKTGWTFLHSGCINDVVQFSDTTSDNNLKKFFWDFGEGNRGFDVKTNYQYASAGKYVASHWATNDIGCGTDTTGKVIAVTDVPVADFTLPAFACEQQMVTLTEKSRITSGGTIKKWHWDFGDQQTLDTSDGQSLQHAYTLPGDNSVLLSVESESGCRSAEARQSISIHVLPNAAFTVPAVCLPAPAVFNNQSSIGDGTKDQLLYHWDFGDGGKSDDASPTHFYDGIGPYSIKLKVTSNYGCSADTTVVLQAIYQQSKIKVQIPVGNCFGESFFITGFRQTEDGSVLDSFYWSVANSDFEQVRVADTARQWQQQIPFTTNGDQLVRIFGMVAGTGCATDTVASVMKTYPLPVVQFSVTGAACEEIPILFKNDSHVSDGSITKWEWNFGNGKTSVEQHPVELFEAGSYNVRLIAVTDKGCRKESSLQEIKIGHAPQPDFELPKICLSDLYAQFTDKSTIPDNKTNSSYQWKFNDPYASDSNPDSSFEKNPTHQFSEAGNYNVWLRVLTEEGCSADTVKKFTVNGIQPSAQFTLDRMEGLCSNEVLQLKDASGVNFGSIIKTEIYWDYGNDPSAKTVDDQPSTGKIYSYRYPETNDRDLSYKVKYVVYSGEECINEQNQTIILSAVPKIRFDSISDVCSNSASFKITTPTLITDLPGNGVFNGKGVSPLGVFQPDIAGVGKHDIMYTYTTDKGCTANAVQTIQILSSPLVDAGADQFVSKGDRISLHGKGTGNGLQFLWTPAIAIENPTKPDALVYPKQDMIYRLTVTSANGCSAFDEVSINMLKEVLVPNAFTPNNDGKNDQWNIPYLKYYQGCTVQIFNRYGQRVFYSEGYAEPWDGRLKGRDLPTGTYCWVIDLNKGSKLLSGTVTLIR